MGNRRPKIGLRFSKTVDLELAAAGSVIVVLVSNPLPKGIPRVRFIDIEHVTGTNPEMLVAGRDSAGVLYKIVDKWADWTGDTMDQDAGPEGCDLIARFTATAAFPATATVTVHGEILHPSPQN